MKLQKINKNSAIAAIAVLIFALSGDIIGQNSGLRLEQDVDSHKGIDSIYDRFSKSYQTLDSKSVADLYTENAAYLSPNSEIRNGRNAILAGFTRLFQRIGSRDQTASISFTIFQRKVEKNLGYDVGIFTLRYFKNGKEVNVSKGKFVVVVVKGKDNKWRFQVDGYSDIKTSK
ncbi:MAG: nuclear transport factor 2 family protein [Pyrinomonadaceae bacterium]|nr:nuclear transport factor 2 family protein [Pyrinomonadaceae bacterium]